MDGSDAALAAARAVFARLLAAEALLGDAAAGEIRVRAADAEALLGRPAYGLAVLGESRAARAAVLGRLTGAELVDPAAEAPAGARVRFRHGARMDYRARLRDGRKEQFARLVPDSNKELGGGIVGLGKALAERGDALAAAEAELAARYQRFDAAQAALVMVERDVTAAEAAFQDALGAVARAEDALGDLESATQGDRALVPVWALAPPRWWQLFTRLRRWLWGTRHRAAVARVHERETRLAQLAAAVRAARDAEAAATLAREERLGRRTAAEDAHGLAARAVAAAEKERATVAGEIGELERDLDKLHARGVAHESERRARFEAAVRELTSMAGRAGEIDELVVDSPGVPEGVLLFEVTTGGHALELQRTWQVLAREVDGCIVGNGAELPREARALFGRALRWPLEPPGDLPGALRRARVRRLVRLAEEAMRVGQQALDDRQARAQEALRRRLDALEARRIRDPEAFVQARLDAAAAQVAERCRRSLQLGDDAHAVAVGELAERWATVLREAAGTGRAELRAAAARVVAGSAAALDAASAHVGQVVADQVKLAAQELVGTLLAALPGDDAPGASAEVAEAVLDVAASAMSSVSRKAPMGPPPFRAATPVSIARAEGLLARLRGRGRLAEECIAEVDAGLERARVGVRAELLTAEPVVRTALLGAILSVSTATLRERERAIDLLIDEAEAQAAADPARDAERALRGELERLVVAARRAEEGAPPPAPPR